MRRQLFIRWVVVLTAVWVFANWPGRYGLAGFFYHGGFPLTYAYGWGNEVHFDWMPFIWGLLIGIGVVFGLSWLCVWSRRIGNRATNAGNAKST